MRKITVLVVCILFLTSVDATGDTLEITEARIAGEKDAEGWHWRWFFASYCSSTATPILLIPALWVSHRGYDLLSCWGAYSGVALTPTAISLILTSAPPPERLLGKSPDWVTAYTKAYQKNVRRYNAAASVAGCVAGTTTLAILSYLTD